MKHFSLLRLFTIAAISFLSQTGFSASWQVVDNYQYVLGKQAYAVGLAKDPAGNLFAAGNAVDGGGSWHALAMRSSDQGGTWSVVDDYINPAASTNQGPGYDGGITSDAAGNLYATGLDALPGLIDNWFVRRSLDAGLTWTTVDSFTLGGAQAIPKALATDAAGNVYVVGTANSAAPVTNYTVVRKGIPLGDGTMSWSTVDKIPVSSFSIGSSANSSMLVCHPSAGVFIAGSTLVSAGKNGGQVSQWVIRRSANGGLTWTTADAYQLDPTQGAVAHGVGVDSFGNLYSMGSANQHLKGKDIFHWIVRKSNNGGGSWTTVDDFLPSPFLTPSNFAADASGNLFVTSSIGLTRKNTGGTSAWVTVANGTTGNMKALLGDNLGNLFSAGQQYDAANVYHWQVRKLVP
ncbi:MAG: hypothetical protein JWM16_6264 [Verrucomicrobiales bacterium]|nr:hypothetical protein [Verrucomicrobiales bacterium]